MADKITRDYKVVVFGEGETYYVYDEAGEKVFLSVDFYVSMFDMDKDHLTEIFQKIIENYLKKEMKNDE